MSQAIRTGVPLVDKALDALWDAADRLKNAITTDKVQSVAIAITDTMVVHGLGRPYKGVIPILNGAQGVVFISPTTNPDPSTQIILRASVAGTYSLVFV